MIRACVRTNQKPVICPVAGAYDAVRGPVLAAKRSTQAGAVAVAEFDGRFRGLGDREAPAAKIRRKLQACKDSCLPRCKDPFPGS